VARFTCARLVLAFIAAGSTIGFVDYACGWQKEGKKAESSSEVAFGTPPLIRLVRDPHTQTDLSVSALQSEAIGKLLAKVEGPLWQIRDFPSSKVIDKGKPLLTELENGLVEILDERQEARLKQIVRQIQSWRGIIEPDMVKELGLSTEQQQKLKEIFAQSTEKQTTISEDIKKAGGKASDAQQRSLRQLQEEERTQVSKTLDPLQQKKLTELVGQPFEFDKLKHLWTKAPEFAASSQWRLSKPLKLAEQRGRVVVIHFFAFGCINCIHNYPWYREWTAKYSPSEVLIVGIHTPETTAEQSVKTLESKLTENKLTFPVAIDNDKANWEAWGNNMWPSVYVIDKEGFVRAWWYGELDWQGAGGQKIIEQRIDELLKEKSR
jgi:peroxiredoxin